ncbi:UcrQ-domain-containing protein [Melanomma pulvis-pyrius CBS 109.77]|uniref:Cytochrome b-c1 complex subunit 8 n=1 Tax=Melanomma pulvis-pyrius CBS 109.77 TaxID=1314802 RepID=A0A6A6XCM8_9PLEO|nr:UcrQ-domain-containing protein [Melanomma pulvis-pyrius CBS 109.77]
MGAGPEIEGSKKKYNWHIGDWGNPYAAGGRGGKGTITYSMSSNRLNPFAGFLKKGIPNTVRRGRNQVLYVVPPFIVAYYTMKWAIERNEYLNSKPGRAEFGEEA